MNGLERSFVTPFAKLFLQKFLKDNVNLTEIESKILPIIDMFRCKKISKILFFLNSLRQSEINSLIEKIIIILNGPIELKIVFLFLWKNRLLQYFVSILILLHEMICEQVGIEYAVLEVSHSVDFNFCLEFEKVFSKILKKKVHFSMLVEKKLVLGFRMFAKKIMCEQSLRKDLATLTTSV